MFKKHGIFSILGLAALLGFSFNAAAYPVLSFDGVLDYTANDGRLIIDGSLTGSQEVNPLPVLAGSSFSMDALFSGLGADTNSFLTVGEFSGIAGSDLVVMGGDGALLLEGELASIEMRGANGFDMGVLTAVFNPTAGLLADQFSPASDLFALQLNLSTLINGELFFDDFSGFVDGSLTSTTAVTSVPEPNVFILLSLGLAMIASMTAVKKQTIK